MARYLLVVSVLLLANQVFGLEVAQLKNQIIEDLLRKNELASKIEVAIRGSVLDSRNEHQTEIGEIKDLSLAELTLVNNNYINLIDDITKKAVEAGQDVTSCIALRENITSIEESTRKLVQETYYDTGRLIVQYFFKVVALLRNHDIIFANIEEVLASCQTIECAEDISAQMEEADAKLSIELSEIKESTMVTLYGITQGYLVFLDNVLEATRLQIEDIAEQIVECVN